MAVFLSLIKHRNQRKGGEGVRGMGSFRGQPGATSLRVKTSGTGCKMQCLLAKRVTLLPRETG